MSNIISAFALGIIEGLTEFLPISSTGHLIIAQQYFKVTNIPVEMFLIVIQSGAILAVIFLYFKKLFPSFRIDDLKTVWMPIIIGFIPAVIFGLLFGDFIQKNLFNPLIVSLGLIFGSILLWWGEKLQNKKNIFNDTTPLLTKDYLAIGLFQCLALIPGMSRSGASIVGGLSKGMSKKQAVEFSFFLSVPTIIGASFYSLLKNPMSIDQSGFIILALGIAVSFFSALLAIKFFIKLVQKTGFKYFIWYRLVLAFLILIIFVF